MNRKRNYYNYQIIFLAVLSIFFGTFLNLFFKGSEKKRIDLSRGSITTLEQKTIDKLSNLQDKVKINYYTSERKRMPTPMRNVESDVRALLREMSYYGEENFDYEVVYPEDSPQVARGLGRFKIYSFQYKTILKDEYRVSTVWSGILIEYKGKSRAIPYITTEHLPHLENRIITHIDQIDTGYSPSVAVHASIDYNNLRGMISGMNFGIVRNFGFTDSQSLPLDADMAFICQPENLSEKHVQDIKTFLKDGKDIFLCFSNYDILEHGIYDVVTKKSGLENYLSDLGVTFEQKIVLEPKHQYNRPFLINVPGSQMVLDGFKLPRAGTLMLPYTSPIRIDVNKLKKNGYSSDTLIFSSKDSWTIPFDDRGLRLRPSDFVRAENQKSKVENLAIVLTSDNPWEGRLFIYACGHILSDSANWNGSNNLYIKNLLMTFAVPDNLVSIRASRIEKPKIPELSGASRLFWRFFVILLMPALGFIIFILKIVKFHLLGEAVQKFDLKLMYTFIGGTIAIFLVIIIIKSVGSIEIDMSKGNVNSLNPLTKKLIKKLDQDVEVIYFTSPSSEMPFSSKKMVKEVSNKLKDIIGKNKKYLKLTTELVSSDGLEKGEIKQKLEKYHIKPFRMRVIENDRYVEKMIYSALVFKGEHYVEVVPRLSHQNSHRLEFVVVSAIKRLTEQKRPCIAFLADLPHLTAGEFWELQQLDVDIQPRNEDVYKRFLELLRNEGYQVNLYDTKEKNTFNEDMMVYIQPWVVEDNLKNEFNRYLRSGKSIVLSVQHYFMQTRKYSGKAYNVSYWPQPQHSRVNELLEPYGIELIKEIFFDQSKAPIDTKEQIRWGAYKKEFKRAPDAQPFIIRAIPANFSKESSITSHLSDILFIWGNRWKKIKEKFPESLKWSPLIESSPDVWSLDWQGGFLSEDILMGGNYFDVKQPLVVEVEGRFPSLSGNKEDVSDKEGKLLLIGSSMFFDNEQLDTTRYDHEKFVLNAVAELAYGKELAQIQASGTPASIGFPYVPPTKKMLWRFLVLVFVPVVFILYGLYRKRKLC